MNEKARYLEVNEEKNEKIQQIRENFSKMYDFIEEITKNSREKIMMANDIETLLSGNEVEKLVEGEPRAISCLKADVIAQNNQLKLLADKMFKIRNALN